MSRFSLRITTVLVACTLIVTIGHVVVGKKVSNTTEYDLIELRVIDRHTPGFTEHFPPYVPSDQAAASEELIDLLQAEQPQRTRDELKQSLRDGHVAEQSQCLCVRQLEDYLVGFDMSSHPSSGLPRVLCRFQGQLIACLDSRFVIGEPRAEHIHPLLDLRVQPTVLHSLLPENVCGCLLQDRMHEDSLKEYHSEYVNQYKILYSLNVTGKTPSQLIEEKIIHGIRMFVPVNSYSAFEPVDRYYSINRMGDVDLTQLPKTVLPGRRYTLELVGKTKDNRVYRSKPISWEYNLYDTKTGQPVFTIPPGP
jgi:hypothetical protein